MSQFTGTWNNPTRDGETAEAWAMRLTGATALDQYRYLLPGRSNTVDLDGLFAAAKQVDESSAND